MDCSFDGETSITKEEWDTLEKAFHNETLISLVRALRLTDNTPQDVAGFFAHQGALGGANSVLLRGKIPFSFELLYKEGFFRENQVCLKRVKLPKPKIVEDGRENSRRCC